MSQYKVVLTLVFEQQDCRTLLIKRSNPPRVWSPPGGYMQDSIKQTAYNEVQEETGLTNLREFRTLGELSNEIVVTMLLADKPSDLPENHHEWDDINWFGLNQVSSLDISPPHDSMFWQLSSNACRGNVLELSRQDSKALVEALSDPPEPGENLKKAAKSYREKIHEVD